MSKLTVVLQKGKYDFIRNDNHESINPNDLKIIKMAPIIVHEGQDINYLLEIDEKVFNKRNIPKNANALLIRTYEKKSPTHPANYCILKNSENQ